MALHLRSFLKTYCFFMKFGTRVTEQTGLVVVKRAIPGFPGGAVVESLPAGAGDMGWSPGLGGSHMPRSG